MTFALEQRAEAHRSHDRLLDQGFVILRGVVDRQIIRRLDADLACDFTETPSSHGLFYGEGTVRFGKLITRSRTMSSLVTHPALLGMADILRRWHSAIQLDFTQAIGVAPGARAQAPHRDGEMWPLPHSTVEHLLNVILPLTPFTARTGATQVWAMSNRGGAAEPSLYPTTAKMVPGDALVFLGSTLHRQGANISDEIRRAVVIGYSAAWLKPSENQSLSYPPSVARDFPDELARLVGYERIAPNLNNFDCRCPSELLGASERGAVDKLHPAQIAALERHFGNDA